MRLDEIPFNKFDLSLRFSDRKSTNAPVVWLSSKWVIPFDIIFIEAVFSDAIDGSSTITNLTGVMDNGFSVTTIHQPAGFGFFQDSSSPKTG